MPITNVEVEKIAELANLELTNEEKQSFSVQLAAIVEYIDQLNKLYSSGEAKPSEICRAALDRIEKSNERLNTFLKLNLDAAMQRAAAMDAEIQSAVQTKPLAGVPVAIKDNMCTAGLRTTCGS